MSNLGEWGTTDLNFASFSMGVCLSWFPYPWSLGLCSGVWCAWT